MLKIQAQGVMLPVAVQVNATPKSVSNRMNYEVKRVPPKNDIQPQRDRQKLSINVNLCLL